MRCICRSETKGAAILILRDLHYAAERTGSHEGSIRALLNRIGVIEYDARGHRVLSDDAVELMRATYQLSGYLLHHNINTAEQLEQAATEFVRPKAKRSPKVASHLLECV